MQMAIAMATTTKMNWSRLCRGNSIQLFRAHFNTLERQTITFRWSTLIMHDDCAKLVAQHQHQQIYDRCQSLIPSSSQFSRLTIILCCAAGRDWIKCNENHFLLDEMHESDSNSCATFESSMFALDNYHRCRQFSNKSNPIDLPVSLENMKSH